MMRIIKRLNIKNAFAQKDQDFSSDYYTYRNNVCGRNVYLSLFDNIFQNFDCNKKIFL